MHNQLLRLKKIRDLDVDVAIQTGRPAFVSAASGLVQFKGEWIVVSDDDDAVARFCDGRPGVFQRVFAGELPLEKKARKKMKSDLEALTIVDGEILAIPSGSTANRNRGALIASDVRMVDFSKLFLRLTEELGPLNLEGAVIEGSQFWLLNRGNSLHGQNAVILLELGQFRKELGQLSLSSYSRTIPYELGSIKGVPLSFTDACPDGRGGVLFLAAAEDTQNSYDDGACVGAALGRIASGGSIDWIRPLECSQKPEGIWRDNSGQVRIVTDADDAQVPSAMYEVTEKL